MSTVLIFALWKTLSLGQGDGCAMGQCQAWQPYFYPREVLAATRVEVTEQPATTPGWTWKTRSDRPHEIYLYHHGVQVGAWDALKKEYRTLVGNTGDWCPIRYAHSPVPIPNEKSNSGQESGVLNFGVDLKHLNGNGAVARYRRNGAPITRDQAFREFTDLPSDDDALRITWIGDEAIGERIRSDLAQAPALTDWRGKVTFQSYRSIDEPMIRGLGFQPYYLHIQAPSGTMLHANSGYHGAEQLAEVAKAAELRRRDPAFDPSKVPDLSRKPLLPSRPDDLTIDVHPRNWPGWVWMLVGIVAASLLQRRRTQ